MLYCHEQRKKNKKKPPVPAEVSGEQPVKITSSR